MRNEGSRHGESPFPMRSYYFPWQISTSHVKEIKSRGDLSFSPEKLKIPMGNHYSPWDGTTSHGKFQLPMWKKSNPVGIFRLPMGNFYFPREVHGEWCISHGKLQTSHGESLIPMGFPWESLNSHGKCSTSHGNFMGFFCKGAHVYLHEDWLEDFPVKAMNIEE